MSRICEIKFTESAEQRNKLQKILAKYKGEEGAVMPVMQQAQVLYGYLPIEIQTRIAEALEISAEEVFGIATFYSQFTLVPKGKYNFSLCLGTACYVRGAGDIMTRLEQELGISQGGCTDDGLFSIMATRCIGCCGLAPVMTVNDEVYGKLTPDEIPKIVKKYKAIATAK